jgi:membrane-associated phospholipid phosphatase
MIDSLLALDHSLFSLMHFGAKNIFFDWLMPILSNGRLWAAPLGFVCVLAVYFGRRRGLFALAVLITAVGLSDLSGNFLKHLFARARPLGGAGDSFPSNHAANSFAFALVVTYFLRNLWARIAVYVLAVMVCFSRVYLASHYPADVIAGACWGTFVAGIIVALSVKYFPGYNGKKPLPK